MKRVLWIVGILAIVATGIGLAFFQNKTVSAAKVEIGRTVKVSKGDIKVTVSESGTLEPVTQVEVKSQVAGRIKQIFVKEGQRVRRGTLIATVDPVDVERTVERIRAQLAGAKASLRQAQENYDLAVKQNQLSIQRAEMSLREAQRRLAQVSAPTRPQEIQQAQESVKASEASVEQAESSANQAQAQVAQVQAAINRVEAQIIDSKRNMERQKALVEKGFVSQAVVDQAQTTLAVAEADKLSQQASLKSAQASYQAAQASLRSAKANLAQQKQRLDLLIEGPRAEDIAPARAAVETAKTNLATEKANAAQAEIRRRDVERAESDVKQIENQLAQQLVQLSETRIVAPIDGEIIGKYVNEGELVASATAGFAQGAVLVRVADLSRMQVRVNINEVDVAKVRMGLPVEVKVDGAPGKVYEGLVDAIAPASLTAQSTTSGTSTTQAGVVRFEVKIRVENSDARIRPGMTASVSIIQDKRVGVLLLPAEAVKEGGKVFVVTGAKTDKKDERVKTEKTITTGLKNDASVEVVSGLNEGEEVEVPKVDAKDRRKINFGPDNEEKEGEGEKNEEKKE